MGRKLIESPWGLEFNVTEEVKAGGVEGGVWRESRALRMTLAERWETYTPLPAGTGQRLPGDGVVINSAAQLASNGHVREKPPWAASKARGKEAWGLQHTWT